MPGFDAIEWANSARREIDATGAAKANPGRGVHSIEGNVNRVSGKPPVPAPRTRAAAPRPFGKPGQKIKGFGNAEGLNRIKGLVPPDPGHIGKYLEDPLHEVLVSKKAPARYDEAKHKRNHGKFAHKDQEGDGTEYERSHWAGARRGAALGAVTGGGLDFGAGVGNGLAHARELREVAQETGASGKTMAAGLGLYLGLRAARGAAVGSALGAGIGGSVGRNVPKHDD